MINKSVTVDFEYDWGSRIKSDYAIGYTTDKILEIFDKNGAKGTFFISTEILPEHKDFVLAIRKQGHEIASHGHIHSLDYDTKSEEDLYHQIKTSKSLLEDIVQEKIIGFRTPAFKKNRHTDKILEELGFVYDSSMVRVSLKGRYEAMQNRCSQKLKYVPISTLYGKFPAGVKWINVFGCNMDKEEPRIIYSHPFDFLSIKETVMLYDKNRIPLHILLFYLGRLGSIYKTFGKIVKNSKNIRDLLI